MQQENFYMLIKLLQVIMNFNNQGYVKDALLPIRAVLSCLGVSPHKHVRMTVPRNGKHVNLTLLLVFQLQCRLEFCQKYFLCKWGMATFLSHKSITL